MTRQLKEEYLELQEEFEIEYEDGGCTCFISPPCGYCVHPGNPENLENTDAAWEVQP